MTTEIDDGEDEQFAARARMGDRPAFERLVRRHQHRAFRFILRMIGSRDEAMDPCDTAPLPEERLAVKQRIGLLERTLRALPVEQREILLLRELEDMSYADIAATLNINEGTVKSRLARARVAVLAHYRQHGEEK